MKSSFASINGFAGINIKFRGAQTLPSLKFLVLLSSFVAAFSNQHIHINRYDWRVILHRAVGYVTARKWSNVPRGTLFLPGATDAAVRVFYIIFALFYPT